MRFLKTCNKATQILTIVISVAAFIMFFLTFATVVSNGQEIALAGSELSFKGKVTLGEETVKMARSADVMLCMILTLVAAVFSGFAIKHKGMRYAAPGVALFTGIYMLVISLSKPVYFIDTRPLTNVTSITYNYGVLGATIALLVAAVVGIAYLLIDDYIAVAETKSAKYTIPQRVVHFFKDYKSEVKKIVWPNFKFVVKNTLVVLVICLIIGAFIWLLDFGLAELIQLLFSL